MRLERVYKPIFGSFAKIKASLVQREVARSAGGIVLNKLKFFKNAEYFELSLQQPLSHGLAVTAPLTQGSLESVQ